jgi:tripartite-type tricarboxylate transporter receptor subunit TctC
MTHAHQTTKSELATFVCAAALFASSFPLQAQTEFPTRPVRMVNPYTPGGSVDLVGRALAAGLSEIWGQQVIIDNRPGAGTQIGSEIVVRAEPDGYTALINSSAIAILTSMYKSMRFDPQKDLAPIALVAKSPFMLVVHPSVAAKTIPELVALAKAQPGKLNAASSGVGSTNHLTMEMLKSLAKIDVLIVPFKGGNPAIASVIGGQTNMIFNTPGTLLGHVAAGKLRGLGVTSRERVDFADLPPIGESVPGFEATVWYGVYGPKTLPARLVQRWNESINRYLKTPAAQSHLKRSHMIAAGGSPADLAAFHKSETERWGAVVKAAGIEPQ